MKKASSSPSVIDPAFFSQCTLEEFREHIQADGFFAGLSAYLKNNGVKTKKNRGYVLPQGDLEILQNGCQFFVPIDGYEGRAWYTYNVAVLGEKVLISSNIVTAPGCLSPKQISAPPHRSEKSILSYFQKVLSLSPESSVPLVQERTLAKMHARTKLK